MKLIMCLVLREIKERRQFLDDMAALGEEKKYLPEIQCEIALVIFLCNFENIFLLF